MLQKHMNNLNVEDDQNELSLYQTCKTNQETSQQMGTILDSQAKYIKQVAASCFNPDMDSRKKE